MTVNYLVGDVRDVMATIPDGSVDLVATSPPFLALRSYLPAGHASKHAEIGSEANPAAFLDVLLELTAEWGRVLAPHGSIAIELGDTYSGTNPMGATANGRQNTGRTQDATIMPSHGTNGPGWPRSKSLALIPQLYAIALAYGLNPLTGQASPAGQWLVRNVIVWHRPNPAVGALGDKFRPSTSYITVATRSPRRWFDLTAVRTAHQIDPAARRTQLAGTRALDSRILGAASGDAFSNEGNPAGAPPLDTWHDLDGYTWDREHDTWTLTTQPSSLAHYAMWPAKLAERLILSMCPAEVCRVCGEPRRRIESHERIMHAVQTPADSARQFGAHGKSLDNFAAANGGKGYTVTRDTTGWTDCGHDAYEPGLTLDCFAGTGTTLAVADLHGRDATGIDIDPRNHDIYPDRYDEVKRALYDTPIPDRNQLDLFGEATA